MNRCYIIGAGFSRAFGFPLAAELMPRIWEKFFEDGKPNFAMNLHESAWRNIITTLCPCCDLETIWPDFEELVTLLSEYEHFRADVEGTDEVDHPRSYLGLKRRLLNRLHEVLCDCESACDEDAREDARKFVKNAYDAKDAIVSFNWDLVLESAAKDLKLPVSYGKSVEQCLQLAKPHGSVNIVEVKAGDWDSGSLSALNVRDMDEELRTGDFLVLRAKDPKDAWQRIVPFSQEGRMMVEPSARKEYNAPWIRFQWKRALGMIRSADEIVIIGFSLPDADFRPRILLQLASIGREPKPKIVLISPNASTRAEHFGSLLGINVMPINAEWITMLNRLIEHRPLTSE